MLTPRYFHKYVSTFIESKMIFIDQLKLMYLILKLNIKQYKGVVICEKRYDNKSKIILSNKILRNQKADRTTTLGTTTPRTTTLGTTSLGTITLGTTTLGTTTLGTTTPGTTTLGTTTPRTTTLGTTSLGTTTPGTTTLETTSLGTTTLGTTTLGTNTLGTTTLGTITALDNYPLGQLVVPGVAVPGIVVLEPLKRHCEMHPKSSI